MENPDGGTRTAGDAVSWKVAVDPETCMASGVCVAARPDLFRLDTESAAMITPNAEPDEDLLDLADTCPAMAITVVDADGVEIGPRP